MEGVNVEDLTNLIKKGVESIGSERRSLLQCLDAEKKKNLEFRKKLDEETKAKKMAEEAVGIVWLKEIQEKEKAQEERDRFAKQLEEAKLAKEMVEKEKEDLVAALREARAEKKRMKLENEQAIKQRDSFVDQLVGLFRVCLENGAVIPQDDLPKSVVAEKKRKRTQR